MESEALLRRRHIPDAQALLRLALAYAVSDLSLKDVAAWAHAMGVAEITGPGLFYRLQEAEGWLQRVLAQTLQSEVESGAGSSLRAGGGCDGHSWPWGEGYGRYRVSAQEVILGDRAYATARGLGRYMRRTLMLWRA